MISSFFIITPFLHKERSILKFYEFFSFTQLFHSLQSIACTENLGLHHYVGFSQIQLHMKVPLHILALFIVYTYLCRVLIYSVIYTDGTTSYDKEDSSLRVHSEAVPYAGSTRRLSDPGMYKCDKHVHNHVRI